MYIGKYHIGLRTLKTSLAVMLCILFFQLTHRGTPLVATLSAVFALREDLSSTISFGKSRIVGNSIGGIGGLLYYGCIQLWPHEIFGQLFFIPLIVTILITFSIRINNKAGIIGGIATFLFISLSIPGSESYIYAFNRVLDTFIGTLIAIFLNYVIKSPLESKEETIIDKLKLIEEKKKEIKELEQSIKDAENIPSND